LDIYDEFEEEFNLSFYLDFSKEMEEVKDEEEYGMEYWDEVISDFDESWKNNKKNPLIYIGENDIQAHFNFYCLYRLVGNDEKALKHAEQAHIFYIKNTISYHWENVAYDALQQFFEEVVVPDCILPNNRKPDLVINPVYNEFTYHPRGTKILRAETIIDMKTSLYGSTKEIQFYRSYCDELIIVYVKGEKRNKNRDITYISSKELKDKVRSQKIIAKIETIERKMEVEFIIDEFEKRFNSVSK